MKTAIIFASGQGKRLLPLTTTTHKSLILINGTPLIEHIINNLLQVNEIKKIIVITGHLHDDFLYLTKKYPLLSLVYNSKYLPFESAYALTLVKEEFNKNNDIFVISGDFIMKENCFDQKITSNVMSAMKRNKNNNKSDWSYQLNNSGDIIDIFKTDNNNSLLASEWTHINKKWAKLIYQDLNNQQESLKNILIGKYLINHSIAYKVSLKPYLLDYDKFWDLDTFEDLSRTESNFSK